jgi:hypothetical protein
LNESLQNSANASPVRVVFLKPGENA